MSQIALSSHVRQAIRGKCARDFNFVVVVVALGMTVVSVGFENRFQSGDRQCAISPATQLAAGAVSSAIQQPASYVRGPTELAYMYPALSLEEILRRFSHSRIDPAERRFFAYRLA